MGAKVGAARRSGGPLSALSGNEWKVVGNFTWANASNSNGRPSAPGSTEPAGNPQGVGGNLLKNEERQKILAVVPPSQRGWLENPTDVVIGTDTAEIVTGSYRSEEFDLGPGENVVHSSNGANHIKGGEGTDTVLYEPLPLSADPVARDIGSLTAQATIRLIATAEIDRSGWRSTARRHQARRGVRARGGRSACRLATIDEPRRPCCPARVSFPVSGEIGMRVACRIVALVLAALVASAAVAADLPPDPPVAPPPSPIIVMSLAELEPDRNVPADQWRNPYCLEWTDNCVTCRVTAIGETPVCTPCPQLATTPRTVVQCRSIDGDILDRLCRRAYWVSTGNPETGKSDVGYVGASRWVYIERRSMWSLQSDSELLVEGSAFDWGDGMDLVHGIDIYRTPLFGAARRAVEAGIVTFRSTICTLTYAVR